ncbi:MAG: hypothetical protein ACLR3C_14945 [Eggerthella lenta]
MPADRLRVFDPAPDARSWRSTATSVPGGFACATTARIPAHRMATPPTTMPCLACAHGGFAWCQCCAAFIPDEVRGDEAWTLFRRVQSVLERELERCCDKLAQARTIAKPTPLSAAAKLQPCSPWKAHRFWRTTAQPRVALTRWPTRACAW